MKQEFKVGDYVVQLNEQNKWVWKIVKIEENSKYTSTRRGEIPALEKNPQYTDPWLYIEYTPMHSRDLSETYKVRLATRDEIMIHLLEN